MIVPPRGQTFPGSVPARGGGLPTGPFVGPAQGYRQKLYVPAGRAPG